MSKHMQRTQNKKRLIDTSKHISVINNWFMQWQPLKNAIFKSPSLSPDIFIKLFLLAERSFSRHLTVVVKTRAVAAFLQIQSTNATAEPLPSVCVASQGLQTDPPAPSASERRKHRERGRNMKEDCKEIEMKVTEGDGDAHTHAQGANYGEFGGVWLTS